MESQFSLRKKIHFLNIADGEVGREEGFTFAAGNSMKPARFPAGFSGTQQEILPIWDPGLRTWPPPDLVTAGFGGRQQEADSGGRCLRAVPRQNVARDVVPSCTASKCGAGRGPKLSRAKMWRDSCHKVRRCFVYYPGKFYFCENS